MRPYAVKRVCALHVRDAAEEHCQAGASLLSNQRVFDWLDKMFKKSKPR